jgi:hypothetical protein
MPISLRLWPLPVCGALLIQGCGGSSNPTTADVYPLARGVLVDAPVGNARFRTGTRSGSTAVDGTFQYFPGESVTFRIGDIILPPTLGRDRITPIEIFGNAANRAANQVNRPAVNLALLLLSLDQDGDPTNGLFISNATHEALVGPAAAELVFDVTAEAFRTRIAALVAVGDTPATEPASVAATLAHLATSLGSTLADSDGDGIFDYEDEQPFDAGGGPGDGPECAIDDDGLASPGSAIATIDFDGDRWAGFGLTLNAFIGSEGIGLPVGPATDTIDLLDVPAAAGFNPDRPQEYPLRPADAVYGDPGRRTARPTDFRYAATDPATLLATVRGQLSLVGVSRWTVAPDRGGGQLLFGDYNFLYNGTTSTWELVNGIDFPLTIFTLANVLIAPSTSQGFTITGDLVGSAALSILLGGALGQDFGSFRLAVSCRVAKGP